jgi:hypothetical protein
VLFINQLTRVLAKRAWCLVLLQVVRTTIQPLHGGKASAYDAYEYNAHSHTYISDHQPTAKFSYDLAAMQVGVLTPRRRCL